jgi:uncharacterized protein YjbI with pentapeptide repeats
MSNLSETPEFLKGRWDSGLWLNALNAIREEMDYSRRFKIDGDFLNNLGLPQINGRLDLRGIPFYVPLSPPIMGANMTPIRLKSNKLVDVDFSWSHMQFYMLKMEIENCVFIETQMDSCYFTHCKVSNSRFDNALLKASDFGGRSSFSECVFNGTKTRYSGVISKFANFKNCSFLNLDWRAMEFAACQFENCIFSGKLANSKIIKFSPYEFYDKIRAFLFGGLAKFTKCDFSDLNVKHLSIENGALITEECIGFPGFKVESKEGRNYFDYFSKSPKR